MASPRARLLLPITLVAVCATLPIGHAMQAPGVPPSAQAPNQNDAVQSYDGPAPAHVAVVDGVATLTREGELESDLTTGPLLAGDRLTTARGRIEIVYGDGSLLDLDDNTSVDLLSDSIVRM